MKASVYRVRSHPGSPLRVVLPEEGTGRFDPFLVFHEQGPVTYEPGEAIGFPNHSHRGFDIVNYIIEGSQYHRDSTGSEGTIHGGDVQWMTAGAGVFHSELPSDALWKNGGPMHAFQIWVDLPPAHKSGEPRYQELSREKLPIVENASLWGRVIAGRFADVVGPAQTIVPMVMVHLRLQPGASSEIEPPAHATVLAYALDGSADVGGYALAHGELFSGHDADRALQIHAGAAGAELFVCAGTPVGYGLPDEVTQR